MKKKKPAKRHQPAHLSHSSYTGKRLPRQYTHYPTLLFLLLCLGVFMTALTLKAGAANVSVTATADGPPPPAPAIITSPAEGDHITSIPTSVKGTCPARFMVKLYRNNVFSGAVLCALDDTFLIQTDLFEGGNQLQAKIFNAVDEEGPISPAIQIFYEPPPEPITQTPTTTQSGNSPDATLAKPEIEPLLIKANNLFRGYYTGDEIDWPLEFFGGTSPYALQVDWGDGTSSLFSRKQAGAFSIHHVYSKPGPNQDSFVIKLNATDADGNKTFLQLMIIIHEKEKVAHASPGSISSNNGLPPLRLSLGAMWPAYWVATLMAASFWLGNQQGLLAHFRPHRHAHK